MKAIIVTINYWEKIQIEIKIFDENELSDIKNQNDKYIAFIDSSQTLILLNRNWNYAKFKSMITFDVKNSFFYFVTRNKIFSLNYDDEYIKYRTRII